MKPKPVSINMYIISKQLNTSQFIPSPTANQNETFLGVFLCWQKKKKKEQQWPSSYDAAWFRIERLKARTPGSTSTSLSLCLSPPRLCSSSDLWSQRLVLRERQRRGPNSVENVSLHQGKQFHWLREGANKGCFPVACGNDRHIAI